MTVELEVAWQYENALWQLTQLVRQRNHLLVRLQSLLTVPLMLSPASGFIGQFDTGAARLLLERADYLAVEIQEALAMANRWGQECGARPLEWRQSPRFLDDFRADAND